MSTAAGPRVRGEFQVNPSGASESGVGKILITGGCGFIGSNLAAHYLANGWEVVAFDNFSRPGAESNAAWLERQSEGRLRIRMGDVRDYEAVVEAMQGAAVVAHLAAQVAVTTSVQQPREDFLINALGGFNVLEAARNSGANPILLYASTNKVYGGLERVRVDNGSESYRFPDLPDGVHEAFPIDLHSPYGCSKGAIDLYMLDYARIYGVRTVVFRQSCVYGPRQFGIEDQGWVAHFVISAALGRPITIYGDGRQVRDVLHVADLIAAFERAIERIHEVAGRAYNLGGGPRNALSLLELIGWLERRMGRPITLGFSDWRPGDQRVYVSDIRRAQRELDWRPSIGIEEGLNHLTDWVQANRELFQPVPLAAEAAATVPVAKAMSPEYPVLLPSLQTAELNARRLKGIRPTPKVNA
jgi:CDP-paratose 2-epimerase